MIDLYYWPTPNGHKVSIMLEETGLPYRVKPVNILKGEQFDPEFLEISPNNRMPAIVDHEGPEGRPYSLFESGAILLYLAEKTGRFLPEAPEAGYDAIQWLMFQMAGVGPMFGQCGHFLGYAPEKVPYAIERYSKETHRLYGVMDRRLAESEYLGGETYTVADIATWPWIRVRWLHEIDIDEYPNVKRWYETVGAREGVRRGTAVLAEDEVIGNPTEEAREALVGERQFGGRK